jgi:phytoene dehydrogenase-like protein
VVILNPEAIIIGAGPAGLLAAAEIAQSGHQVQVLEEHPEIGKPASRDREAGSLRWLAERIRIEIAGA